MKKFLIVASIVALLGIVLTGVVSAQGSTYERTLTIISNLRTAHVVGDTATFTGTQVRDTVLCAGTLATDFFIMGVLNDTSAPSLSYIAKVDTVIFLRKAAGTSALQIGYIRLRPYKP